jgi:hypothetical protein
MVVDIVATDMLTEVDAEAVRYVLMAVVAEAVTVVVIMAAVAVKAVVATADWL